MDTKITAIEISQILRAEYNPRVMPADELAALKKSIKAWGFVQPLLVNVRDALTDGHASNVLVAGHQRLTALEQLIAAGVKPSGVIFSEAGTFVPCMTVTLDLEQEKLLNIAMNKISGKWDDEKLASIIIELKDSPFIPASGFRDDEISRILDAQFEEPEDETDEGLPAEPRSQFGEIYELGPHRLVCGDSTDPTTYSKLLGKEQAAMIWTDPPYNVAYKTKSQTLARGGVESIKNDDMTPEQFREFIDRVFYSMIMHTKIGGSMYICSGWGSYPQFLESMLKNGFQHSGVIIWVKNTSGFGFNDYKYKHEWIAKAKKPEPKTAEGIIYGWKSGTHKFHGDNEFDVWEMPRKSTMKYLHPTEKPDWLPMRAMRNSTDRDDIVLDPFAGSGSVMAAADKCGRRAFMVELDPKFCDVIRDRWDRLVKAKAKKENESEE